MPGVKLTFNPAAGEDIQYHTSAVSTAAERLKLKLTSLLNTRDRADTSTDGLPTRLASKGVEPGGEIHWVVQVGVMAAAAATRHATARIPDRGIMEEDGYTRVMSIHNATV